MKTTKVQYLGFLIERGAFGWYVLDWDYETETVIHLAKNKTAAMNWIDRRTFGFDN